MLVNPGMDKVIALAPEFITPQEGSAKQNCEPAAAKRWLAAHGAELDRLKRTVLGDDLYCHEPFCREQLALGLDFILVLVWKPASHPIVDEWLARSDCRRSRSLTVSAGGETDTPSGVDAGESRATFSLPKLLKPA